MKKVLKKEVENRLEKGHDLYRILGFRQSEGMPIVVPVRERDMRKTSGAYLLEHYKVDRDLYFKVEDSGESTSFYDEKDVDSYLGEEDKDEVVVMEANIGKTHTYFVSSSDEVAILVRNLGFTPVKPVMMDYRHRAFCYDVPHNCTISIKGLVYYVGISGSIMLRERMDYIANSVAFEGCSLERMWGLTIVDSHEVHDIISEYRGMYSEEEFKSKFNQPY